MAIVDFLLLVASRFGAIIAAPAKQPDMLWILVPIYINWLFTDYFQERKGTHFGNAMTNGAVTLWVGLDWIRHATKEIVFNTQFVSKILMSAFLLLYGLFIIIETAKAKPIAKYIGRVREVSYFAIVLTPIFYGVIAPELMTFLAILIFFPIVYLVMEIIERLLPAPPGEDEDEFSAPGMKMPDLEPTDFGSGAGAPGQPFGAMPPMGGGGMPKF